MMPRADAPPRRPRLGWKAAVARIKSVNMSSETQEILRICEQLPAARRAEVADCARALLAGSGDPESQGAVARWLVGARGAAKPGVTTDQLMALTRGEP